MSGCERADEPAPSPVGPPPVLAEGDDDIFWVNQLQAGLLRAGFYPGEEEMEDWVFGGGTQSALLTFQAASPSRPLSLCCSRLD